MRSPKSWSATGLPADLTIDTNTGEISGYCNTLGTHNITIYATNSFGQSAGAAWELIISSVPVIAPVITSPSSAVWIIGESNYYQITYTGSEPVEVGVILLPEGFTYNPTNKRVYGIMDGPRVTFRVTASNSAGGDILAVTITANI